MKLFEILGESYGRESVADMEARRNITGRKRKSRKKKAVTTMSGTGGGDSLRKGNGGDYKELNKIKNDK